MTILTNLVAARPGTAQSPGDVSRGAITVPGAPGEVVSSTLPVPGATLYYEVRGSGPLLLMIPGGPADAGAFDELARRLADRYTVVAYDPRGNSRSRLEGSPVEQNLDVHGDDASSLIESFGAGPAFVFGSSGGAQIALNLAARHPGIVRVVVAHEPPCILLLDDADEAVANNELIYQTYVREGVGPAMGAFMTLTGMTREQGEMRAPPPSPEAADVMGRIEKNLDYFLGYGLKPLSSYRPDVQTLRANGTRVVVGVGELTEGQTAHRTALALAERLGVAAVVFPGDHTGYGPHAGAFAELLHEAFATPAP